MQTISFAQFLKKQTSLSDAVIAKLLGETKTIDVKKGDFLLRQGDICKQSLFVEKGLLRYYSIDEKGKIHVLQFSPEGWLVSDRESAFFNQPSPYFIDALEDSTLVLISTDFLHSNTQMVPELEEMNSRLLHNHIRQLQNRINLLLSATVEERYLNFIETYPDVLMRVPQHLVASYLGVTPEGLSRVRKELSDKQKKERKPL